MAELWEANKVYNVGDVVQYARRRRWWERLLRRPVRYDLYQVTQVSVVMYCHEATCGEYRCDQPICDEMRECRCGRATCVSCDGQPRGREPIEGDRVMLFGELYDVVEVTPTSYRIERVAA